MATLCVSLPSTVVGCRGSDRGQFTGRRLQARFGSSPLGRRFRGGVSKQVNLKVWTVRASLEVRTRFDEALSQSVAVSFYALLLKILASINSLRDIVTFR